VAAEGSHRLVLRRIGAGKIHCSSSVQRAVQRCLSVVDALLGAMSPSATSKR
jgi:hypothetical protein